MSEADPRARRAEEILRDLGVEGRVEVRGQAGEIAALVVPEGDRAALMEDAGSRLAERIRALGFRFVALDIDPARPGS